MPPKDRYISTSAHKLKLFAMRPKLIFETASSTVTSRHFDSRGRKEKKIYCRAVNFRYPFRARDERYQQLARAQELWNVSQDPSCLSRISNLRYLFTRSTYLAFIMTTNTTPTTSKPQPQLSLPILKPPPQPPLRMAIPQICEAGGILFLRNSSLRYQTRTISNAFEKRQKQDTSSVMLRSPSWRRCP